MESNSNRTDLWRQRVLAQQVSGQSVRGWCRANNCPEPGFYWWRAKLGLSPAPAVKPGRLKKDAVGFARVVVESSGGIEPLLAGDRADRAAAGAMRLVLGGGRELVLPGSMPIEQVAKLLGLLEGRS